MALLSACTTQLHEPTASFLAQRRASVEFEGGIALIATIRSQNWSLLQNLLNGNGQSPSHETMEQALKTSLQLGHPTRLKVTRSLVDHGLSPVTRCSHLREVVEKHDSDLLSLLLVPGGIQWKHDKGSLEYCSLHGFLEGVKVLTQNDLPHKTVATAFQQMVKAGAYRQQRDTEIAAVLLVKGLSKALRDGALVDVFESSVSDLPKTFIGLLLKHGADPATKDGLCFSIAAKKKDTDVFTQLLTRPFDLTIVLRSLVGSIDNEKELGRRISLCTNHGSRAQGARDGALLKYAMERFPRGQSTLALLLDQGYDPGYILPCLDQRKCRTLLIWALGEESSASDDVVIELLSRGKSGK